MTRRAVVLDTETTGFDPAADKLVEVGCVELINGATTGRTFHAYINPCIPVPQAATAVHGLTDDFLADKPPFAAVAAPLAAFLGTDPIIAHNAAFDVTFLAAAFGAPLENIIVDSLALARKKHPNTNCSLDALCTRYGVDRRNRTKHGALLDAGLLAEVYCRLISEQMAIDFGENPAHASASDVCVILPRTRPLASRLSESELALHEEMLATIPNAIWLRSLISINSNN